MRECGLKYICERLKVFSQMSLPLRECGLKFFIVKAKRKYFVVTPLAGVWIEISKSSESSSSSSSLPLRECGLKFMLVVSFIQMVHVTPLAGVWIEIKRIYLTYQIAKCHSPCGSVD